MDLVGNVKFVHSETVPIVSFIQSMQNYPVFSHRLNLKDVIYVVTIVALGNYFVEE